MKTYRIGRSSENDIVINDNSLMISRYHAVLKVYNRDVIYIEDSSTNGTYINGRKTIKGVETVVNWGDNVLFAGKIPLDWSMIERSFSNSTDNRDYTEINSQNNSSKSYYIPQKMFSNVFSFEGRIRRLEYAISNIIYGFAAYLLNQIVINNYSLSWLYLAFIPMMWFIIAQNTKRCHDVGRSGWYQLIPFYAIWLLFAEGDSGVNRYGKNPKVE